MTSGSDDYPIRVSNLSKVFKVYRKPADMLMELVTRRQRHTEFWALHDVSFELQRGEVVGVVGRNGAGKSTLLKIVAGLMEYDSGSVEVNGSVSSILELGTGFHPEYTGRENVYMGGIMLGMTRQELDRKFDDIVGFAELEQVIDQPFRTYSSGMKARLTFSVAISVDPEIFIVDEALAVGDAAFVSKCLARITEICKSGSTVLFVSHSTDIVRRLCNRAIYLQDGHIKHQGPASLVTDVYDLESLGMDSQKLRSEQRGTRMRNGPADIVGVTIHNSQGKESAGFFQHEPMTIRLKVVADEPLDNPAIWVNFTRGDGVAATSWLSHEPDYNDIGTLMGETTIELVIDDLLLGDGQYDLTFALFPKRERQADTAYYTDPIAMWSKTHRIQVQRHSRPLSTLFDQPVRIKVITPTYEPLNT